LSAQRLASAAALTIASAPDGSIALLDRTFPQGIGEPHLAELDLRRNFRIHQ
jgi:hypothetical protein